MNEPTFHRTFRFDRIFSDHMVLQRKHPIRIYGYSRPDQDIRVRLAQQIKYCKSSAQGCWETVFPARSAAAFGLDLEATTHDGSIICRDICVGDVWLCSGQSNMDQRVSGEKLYWCGIDNEQAEIAAASFPCIRVYSVKLQFCNFPCSEVAGKENEFVDPKAPPYSGIWTVCEPNTVGDFSAVAYFFAREMWLKYEVPIGIVCSCYGASTIQSWISQETLAKNTETQKLLQIYGAACDDFETGITLDRYRKRIEEWETTGSCIPYENGRRSSTKPRFPRNPKKDQHSPTLMFNGMIHPLRGLSFQGAVWYHGESNQPTADLYLTLLRMLISEWKGMWSDLFLVVVQLANINQADDRPLGRQGIPKIREAQRAVGTDYGVATVVTIDIGSENLHGANKQEVGRRICLAVRAQLHNEEIPWEGPVLKLAEFGTSSVILQFANSSGLYSSNLKRTFISSDDGINFLWADAEIKEAEIIVLSPLLNPPKEVRYAWSENPIGLLFNKTGLPASPFRVSQVSPSVKHIQSSA